MKKNFWNLFDKKFWKFILVGVINTIFGYAIMFGLYNLLGCGYWFSSAMNYILASILSYFLNKYFTFKSSGSILLFAVNIATCYLIAYGVAQPLMRWALEGVTKSLQENLAMLLGSCIFVGLNYLTQRFITFSTSSYTSIQTEGTSLPDGVSVVMPAYNEGEKIYDNLLETSKAIAAFCGGAYEIIAVNDGSSDNTLLEMQRAKAADNHIVVVDSQPNHGKGFAIRKGASEAKYRYTAFCDSDLDVHPKQLDGYLQKIRETDCVGVIASKLHKESKVEYPFKRKVITYVYYIVLKLFFGLNLKDTQTGLKLYKTNALQTILPMLGIDRFAYDIEILAVFNAYNGRVISAPCEITFTRGMDGSRIKMKDVFRSAKDTIRVFFRLYFKRSYKITEKKDIKIKSTNFLDEQTNE